MSRSSFVLNQCTVVQKLLDKLYKNIKQNANEVETCTKSIIHHLEFKIQSKVQEGIGEEMQEQQILKFCGEAQGVIKECAGIMTQYEDMMAEINNIQMPEFKVSRESCFRAEPLVLNPELKDFTNFVTNLTLQPNLYVFQDRENNSTEFVKVSTSGDSIEAVASFPVLFSHVT